MNEAISELREFVRRRSGINLGADKDYLVCSRLEPLLSGWSVPSLKVLAERLRIQPSSRMAEEVISALTTNETLWFRDGRPFEMLRTIVLPDLVARNASSRAMSFWSAACSTGQEIYSIAMLLRDEEPRLKGWNLSLTASDISEPALARARTGRYSQFEVQRGLPTQKLTRDFDKAGDEWKVKSEISRSVRFLRVNLLEIPADIGPFDVVFCRNVLIYFEIDIKSRVLDAIASRTRSGGYLFLGGAETATGLTRHFAPASGIHGLYQKVT